MFVANFEHLLRFYPSKAKVIADRIVNEELNGVAYNEEDAKHWSLNISDKVREAVVGKILCLMFSYTPKIVLFTESLGKSRYKVVVQTTIGQLKDQGIRVGSRCLWDSTTDNYASCYFSNVSFINSNYKYSHDYIFFYSRRRCFAQFLCLLCIPIRYFVHYCCI